MSAIYETRVMGSGPEAASFAEMNMLVLFGEDAPDMLKEYCYFITLAPVEGVIAPGQDLVINETRYPITAVGDVAGRNLANLGHISVVFDGATEPHLPGSINVSNPGTVVPVLVEGDTLTIE
ncbi:PTS glucitol/sorbitol transporter subunit IIA [Microbacterium sp.]|uniref:PTS glucitol/sorbitol transporter subunit IIA n=1 Tax=Microbacterium sp. TaxID=51671 RepID=UPI003C728582